MRPAGELNGGADESPGREGGGTGRGRGPVVWWELSGASVVAYLFLSAAILFEVIATSFLRFTTGERAAWWSYPVVVGGYTLAFVALALALGRGIPLGIAYAVWAGVGVVLVTLVSRFVFGEFMTGAQIIGVGLVVAGVVLLELGVESG
ncbi:DMT family transporter [Nannocystis punicea]|uniref:SMR family transporter n=1 Tax=Nannocystis punicea TaxID=2995304 RepID=A0ABY7GTC5_9BACT|nr:SMR family transporter [Nannocystis poenicansa]WAS90201.1 SMR family transporter [Nannocystis poenicansa]